MFDQNDSPIEAPALSPEERAEAERVALYRYHRAAGSIEDYYAMYPLDRPPGKDRENER